ncbi:MAG: tetratricopeptide repeat protein [Candidatus Hydrogenedentes bacterium]|nr:tetratricopeptide repeat protein [Candidatus Hydrogenedentota bacterium]
MGASISLAMIVKDEADQLGECLASVRDAVSEICVVDTGSTDTTLEIAKAQKAKLSVYLWCDDFAAARNESLRLCTMDWIFVLDADERLAARDLPALQALARSPHDTCYRFTTRNYTNNSGVSEFHPCEPNDPNARGFEGWYPSTKVRFFPNRAGAKFEGKVHELVNQSLERQGIRVVDSPIPIHHYPLSREPEKIRKKQEMYLHLGHEKVMADPKDPNAYAELGNQYVEVGDYANAAGAYREAIKLDPTNAGLLKDLGGVLYQLKRYEDAHKALRLAIERDPKLVDAWRNLGVLLVDTKEYEGAIECFQQALKLDPAWSEGHRYLSVAIEGAGRLPDAAEESGKALKLLPRSLECLRLYIHQMLRLERRAEARTVILDLISGGHESPELHNALGELFYYDNLHEESKEHFRRAGDGGLTQAYNNLGVVYFKQGQLPEARAAFEKCLEVDPSHRGARSNLEKVMNRLG